MYAGRCAPNDPQKTSFHTTTDGYCPDQRRAGDTAPTYFVLSDTYDHAEASHNCITVLQRTKKAGGGTATGRRSKNHYRRIMRHLIFKQHKGDH